MNAGYGARSDHPLGRTLNKRLMGELDDSPRAILDKEGLDIAGRDAVRRNWAYLKAGECIRQCLMGIYSDTSIVSDTF